jgi:soluble lytic murein transglycosylase
VQRAQAFFRLNLRTEGVREWNWALRSMSDRELLAASEIAVRAGNLRPCDCRRRPHPQ